MTKRLGSQAETLMCCEMGPEHASRMPTETKCMENSKRQYFHLLFHCSLALEATLCKLGIYHQRERTVQE